LQLSIYTLDKGVAEATRRPNVADFLQAVIMVLQERARALAQDLSQRQFGQAGCKLVRQFEQPRTDDAVNA
jgi:hypothetical protein